jgi:hypothetical protein
VPSVDGAASAPPTDEAASAPPTDGAAPPPVAAARSLFIVMCPIAGTTSKSDGDRRCLLLEEELAGRKP